jgi:hypothetical protein
LDAGEDRVVDLYRVVGRGTASGVPVSREQAILRASRRRRHRGISRRARRGVLGSPPG